MSRVFDCDFVTQLAADIENEVVPVLESTNEVLPELSAVDRSLYTAVTLPMAAAYTMATSTVTESMAGAAQGFRDMRAALDDCVKDMRDADDACSSEFTGN